MATRTYAEAVEITVKWWSEKSFQTAINQNNGDDSPAGGIVFLLQNMLSTKVRADTTPEMIAKFEANLTENLMSVENDSRYKTELSVDYHPNKMLSDACTHAGIDASVLPCKSSTSISESNEVYTYYQYGSPRVIL